MASHIVVVDATFKQTRVKVSPGTYMREVLEEACRGKRLRPEDYMLKTPSNKAVDLSQPFRLSGLSAGAKLQLTQASKSPGVVSVALQLPEVDGGGRLSDKFPSTTSLWLILRKFEDAIAGAPAKKLNLTQRGAPSSGSGAGRLMYERPCVHLMGRNLDSFEDLQKTLAQLGLNGGTALLRLTFKATQQPLEEAMQEISAYFGSTETTTTTSAPSSSATENLPDGVDRAPTAAGGAEEDPHRSLDNAQQDTSKDVSQQDVSMADATAASASDLTSTTSTAPTDESTSPRPANAASSSPPFSNISVYLPPTSNTPAAALQHDDPSVFEPSIDHAKAHQAALQRSSRNTRLLSDAELAAQTSAQTTKLAAVHTITIRVRYPDQSQIETVLPGPTATPLDLYTQVAETLSAGSDLSNFDLRFANSLTNKPHDTLPRTQTKRLVHDLGFRGKILVTLVWTPDASSAAREGPSLKEEFRARARDLKVDLQTTQAKGEEGHRVAMAKQGNVDDAGGGGKEGKGKGKQGDVEAKMKKFLGFGKK